MGVIARIVHSIRPQPGDQLVEIGPGLGAITGELLKAAGEIHAVELDRDLIEPLKERCAGLGNLTVHSADALKFDFCQLAKPDSKLRLVGNLPYNISTPILFHLLDQSHCIQDMYFMLQKEVVDRMCAGPGSKTFGRLSVMIQVQCDVAPLFTIGPGAFRPAPKVDSAIVRLKPFDTPRFEIDDNDLFRKLVTAAFSMRRKTLRNGLKGMMSSDQIEAVGIDPGIRAERLEPGQFVALANAACKTTSSS